MSYDRAITVFSPDGQLLQVQYAHEAVKQGSPVVGIKGTGVVVLAVEKRAVQVLQEQRSERKIAVLDDHIAVAFAGLRADARVLISRAQIEAQSYRLLFDDFVTVDHLTRYLAEMKQTYTQSNGRRPFGVSFIVGGFDYDGIPHLYQTEPSGIYYEWKAAATGRHDKDVREYLEKRYKPEKVASDDGTIKLAIKTLMKIVRTRQNNLDVAVIKRDEPIRLLDTETIDRYVAEIQRERALKEAKKASSGKKHY